MTEPGKPVLPSTEATRSDQHAVAAGMVIGVALSAIIAWYLWSRIGITPRRIEMPERLAYAAKWSLVPGICVLIGVLMQANHRFFTPGINPLDGWTDHWLAVWQRYTRNTLEKRALFVIGIFAYSTITYQYWLKVIPIIAVLFAVGRLLFVVGYLIKPSWRGAGFVMTFWPLIGLYGLTAYLFWFG